jgi:hypothetical protein
MTWRKIQRQITRRRRRRRTWQKMKPARSSGSCSSTALTPKNKPLQVLALEEVEEEYSVGMQIPSGYESSLLPSAKRKPDTIWILVSFFSNKEEEEEEDRKNLK